MHIPSPAHVSMYMAATWIKPERLPCVTYYMALLIYYQRGRMHFWTPGLLNTSKRLLKWCRNRTISARHYGGILMGSLWDFFGVQSIGQVRKPRWEAQPSAPLCTLSLCLFRPFCPLSAVVTATPCSGDFLFSSPNPDLSPTRVSHISAWLSHGPHK